MKRILFKLSCFLALAIGINTSIGYLRFKLEDEIPYQQNKRASFVTQHQFLGRASKSMMLKTRTDLGHDSINLPNGIHRVFDAYGFSNQAPNPNPKVLFLGDSFFDDPHTATDSGLQATCNAYLGGNLCYNIGANGCSGFAVYNELYSAHFFSTLPQLIVLETVERALWDHIGGAEDHLISGTIKTKKRPPFGVDLLLGNNFKNWRDSKFFRDNWDRKYGFIKQYKQKKYWFLRNRLTYFAQQGTLITWMKHIQSELDKRKIKIVFVIAPDKESLFPQFFGTSNIPKLHQLMKEEGLDFIDMYGLMIGRPDDYYFPTDTHWNGKAIRLLSKKVAEYYQQVVAVK